MESWSEMHDYVGEAGSADKLDTKVFGIPEVNLAMWKLHCPGQSPAWDWYMLSLIALKDVPGVPAPVKWTDSATHEIGVVALMSEPSGGKIEPLTPVNYVAQLVLTDDQAIELTDALAKAVADGLLWAEPPLSGQRDPWDQSIMLTIEHILTGGHPER